MKGFILSAIAGAIAFALLLQVLPTSMVSFEGELPWLIGLSLAVGAVNAVVKPILQVLTFPISILTMGLTGFVINAGLLMGVAFLAQSFPEMTFTIGGWPETGITADTIVGAVVTSTLLSIVTAVVGLVVRD